MARCPNMPADWQPPAPAWRCTLDQAHGLIVAHFGSQSDRAGPNGLDNWLEQHRLLEDAPIRIDRAHYRDAAGKHGRLALCYWSDRSRFERWLAAAGSWWSDDARLAEGVGYFSEIYDVPADRFETIWSSPDAHPIGVRDFLEVEGPMREHGYWGAARDRLAVSADDDLESPLGSSMTLSTGPTEGVRIEFVPPENLCVIRSGQDWTRCNALERETYFTRVEPALRAGMLFLSQNPTLTGCLDCRFAQEIDLFGEAIDRTFGLGQFLTLAHLERWSKSHETHLTIFDAFMAMLAQHDFNISLHLYHEVFVTRRDNPAFQYINCHNRTGLLTLGRQERKHAAAINKKGG